MERRRHAQRCRRLIVCLLLACSAAAAAAAGAADGAASRAESVEVPGFGAVALVREQPRPRRVVVLLSAGTGWDESSQEMARVLAHGDALVIGVDTRGYVRRLAKSAPGCVYPAGSFEELAEMIEKRLEYPRYATPFLAGLGAGAGLAYAGIVESPVGTFAGLITLAFRPQLITERDLCPGRGLAVDSAVRPRRVKPSSRLEQPWVALQGEADAELTMRAAADFVRQVPGARLVPVPRLGTPQGAAAGLWEAPLRTAFAALASAAEHATEQEAAPTALAAARGTVADLPILELPARGAATGLLAVVVSGDGGWNGVDRKVARVLSERGVAVAGLNSKDYFWTARTPERAAADLGRLLIHYLAAWHCSDAILAGYSLGADALPFMISRLPPELLDRVRLVALMSPGPATRLEVFTQLEVNPPAGELPVLPELLKLQGRHLLCLYGGGERHSICPRLGPPAHAVKLPGAHGLSGDFDALVTHILDDAHAAAPAAKR